MYWIDIVEGISYVSSVFITLVLACNIGAVALVFARTFKWDCTCIQSGTSGSFKLWILDTIYNFLLFGGKVHRRGE